MNQIFLENWYNLYNSHFVGAACILASTLCGIIVGYERQKKNKPAGIKTIMLVCLGSTIFAQLSFIMSVKMGDPTRIAAQVVSGVGFLGAGAVMRSDAGVSGLTTAASIWIIAAIGLVSGSGYPMPALGLSIFVSFVLQLLSFLERKYFSPNKYSKVQLTYQRKSGKGDILIMDILDELGIDEKTIKVSKINQERSSISFKYDIYHRYNSNFLRQFAQMDEVISIHHE